MTDIIDTLRRLYETRTDDIEGWFINQRKKAAPFFYSSVDLRHSGKRLTPVDTNLYPAGFNNLSIAARGRASRYAQHAISEANPNARNILIVPESHTRNLAYLENLHVLQDILTQGGYAVRIGTLASEEVAELESSMGNRITQYPLAKENRKLVTKDGFVPDIVILNNDLTGGMQPLLEDISQPILPPASMGWYRRRKSEHFAAYTRLAVDFSQRFSLDPWFISAISHHCGMVDFKEPASLEKVAVAIDNILARTKAKYDEYGITDEPYVFVKADSGTYGMGIMTVKSGAEILELNKKERNKMQVIKEGTRVSEVILQEGIPTIDQVEGKPAEPMVYIIDGLPVGGMFRVNGARDTMNNLNAAGMEFVGMCDEAETSDINRKSVKECDFHAYGLIGAIAALAAAQEKY